ncbi:C39 family peptidase [Acetanaerobacterium elongatum]|uniref:Uncharacterized protein YvpB n=1 Tax=Acetanaerobacterium elongatum TaxID=258515 RepID=A0A1H0CGW3_9FIRM|nr:C39 family peptidase [Acetanaerobacterium elongatum]SDN57124.1 Uncharacterized protein YvpB [Acetanaerobacterium elongatum]
MILALNTTVFALPPTVSVEEYDYEAEQQVLNEQPYIPMESLDFNDNDYAIENKKAYDLGKSIQQRDFSRLGIFSIISPQSYRFLAVTHYYQDDSEWASDIMQPAGYSIADGGCALTSFAMISSYLGDYHTPRTMNIALGNKACPFLRDSAASQFGYTILNSLSAPSNSTAVTTSIGCIALGRPVFICLRKGTTSNYHWVVAYGYNDNSVMILDPEGDWDYSNLSTYLNNGWNVRYLNTFSA